MDEIIKLIGQMYLRINSLHLHVQSGPPYYSDKIDKELGEIECLLHSARQEIDDEWRAARETSRGFQMPKVRLVEHDSDEIKQIIADLFEENEREQSGA